MRVEIKQVVLCTLGTMFEWYDFSLFASLTPLLSEIFFPNSNPVASLMSTLMIFAGGFIMRPVGAIFFGHFGDRIGRKSTLLITILIMTIATTGMGLIPVGVTLSTLLLVICRLAQGFAASGEYPGGIVLLSEQLGFRRKAFISSFGRFAAVIGIFLGTFVCTIVTKAVGHENMIQYEWRIPFLLGAPIGLIVFLIRTSLLESVEFQIVKQASQLSRIPIIVILRKHYKEFAIVFCFYILSNVSFHVNFIYFSSYFLSHNKIDLTSSMYLNSLTTLIYAISILFFGFLSDQFSKTSIMITACVLMIILVYPLFVVILNGSFYAQITAQVFLAILIGMYGGPLPALAADYFPTQVRYTGIATSLNFSAAIFGGTAPLICTWLAKITHNPISPSYYVMLAALLSLLATMPAILMKRVAILTPERAREIF